MTDLNNRTDTETIAWLEGIIEQLQAENEKLKEILFCIGEIAVCSFEDSIVGLVDSALPEGYRIPQERFEEILKERKE